MEENNGGGDGGGSNPGANSDPENNFDPSNNFDPANNANPENNGAAAAGAASFPPVMYTPADFDMNLDFFENSMGWDT